MINTYDLKHKAVELAKRFSIRELTEPQTVREANEQHELNEDFYEIIMLGILEKAKYDIKYPREEYTPPVVEQNYWDKLFNGQDVLKVEGEFRIKK